MLIAEYTKVNIKKLLAYKADFAFNIVAVSIWISAGIINLSIFFSSANSLAGWSYEETCFLYGMWSMTFAIYNTFGAGILDLEDYIVSGKFDSLLLKPVRPLLQIVTLRINTMGIGFLLIGTICLLIAALSLNIQWTIYAIIYLITAILAGGLLVFSSFWILATLSFWFGRANNLIKIGYDIHKFTQYPISIYNHGVQAILYTVFPYAFSNYLPVACILGKASDLAGAISIIFCGLVFAFALWFWNLSLKKYEGSGS